MPIVEQWVVLGSAIVPTLVMGGVVIMLCLVNWRHGRKIRELEVQLGHNHQALRQEVKMMGQGAIGVGNRVKHLEKQLRTQPSPFEQLLMHPAHESEPASKKTQHSVAQPVVEQSAPDRTQSRAEQSLAQWMNETRRTA